MQKICFLWKYFFNSTFYVKTFGSFALTYFIRIAIRINLNTICLSIHTLHSKCYLSSQDKCTIIIALYRFIWILTSKKFNYIIKPSFLAKNVIQFQLYRKSMKFQYSKWWFRMTFHFLQKRDLYCLNLESGIKLSPTNVWINLVERGSLIRWRKICAKKTVGFTHPCYSACNKFISLWLMDLLTCV